MKIIDNYEEELSKIKKFNEIVSIYCDKENKTIAYKLIEIGNKESLEKLIGESDGKALSYCPSGDYKYWLLTGKKGFVLFEHQNSQRWFASIEKNIIHIQQAVYLFNL